MCIIDKKLNKDNFQNKSFMKNFLPTGLIRLENKRGRRKYKMYCKKKERDNEVKRKKQM